MVGYSVCITITQNMLILSLFFMVASALANRHCAPETIGGITSSDPTYDVARQQFASRMGPPNSTCFLHPAVIVYCKNDTDVLSTLAFATRCGYKVSVRSGGHNYAGYSSCVQGTRCLQLDVSQLETLHIVGNTVTVGVGLTLEQVVDELVPRGLLIPMGDCKTVGIGGHFQSSSFGFFTRAFGLGMDHLISFRLTLKDGRIWTVTLAFANHTTVGPPVVTKIVLRVPTIEQYV